MPSSTPEATLTRFFIFVPKDEARTTWEYVGAVLARDRKQAGTKHFGRASDLDERVEYVAVSENAWRIDWAEPPRPSRGSLEMPGFEAPEEPQSPSEAAEAAERQEPLA